MVKRKSLKFLSIALAVVVVGSALYYGTSKYISADVESDGEWANFKNLTTDEMRTIIFDAYVSNISKQEDPFVVTRKALVTYDDLSSGKIAKVPVDSLKRYEYWQNYWDDLADRTPKSLTSFSNNVAYAADATKADTPEATKLKADLLSKLSEYKDMPLAEMTTALSSIMLKINSGEITSVPSDESDFEVFIQSEIERGSQIEAKTTYDIWSRVGGDNLSKLSDPRSYNAAVAKARALLATMNITDKRFSDRMLLTAYENIYVTSAGKTPVLTEKYVKDALIKKALELAEAAEKTLATADIDKIEVTAPTMVTTGDGDMTYEFNATTGEYTQVDTSSVDEEYNEWLDQGWEALGQYETWAAPEEVAISTARTIIHGNAQVLADTKGQADDVGVKTVGPIAATAAVVDQQELLSEVKKREAERNALTAGTGSDNAANKGLNVATIAPTEEESGQSDDSSSAFSTSSKINTGWKGVGTVGINPNTGRFEYRSAIEYNGTKVGYMSFDPANARTDAQLHYAFSGKEVSLYAEPTTGDIYLEVGSTNGDPLYAIGETIDSYEVRTRVENGKTLAYIETVPKKVNGLMSVIVAKDGSIGGSFRYMNRVFNYNPNSKAFEIPINIDSGFKVGDNTGSKTIYLDSKGGVRGNISVVNSGPSTGNLYFTRTGTIGFTYNYAELDSAGKAIGSLGGVSIDSTGSIAGTVNAGKLTGLKTNLFIGFDNTGISSVSVPIGNIAGNAVGFTYSKDGIALGSFINLGVPIPISLAQDRYGGWTLSLPFIGSILKLGQNVDESPDPPAPKLNEDGSIDLNYIHIARYETSRWFKTYRFYQVQPVKLSKEEMFERSQIIFDKYNEHLKRNPSIEEFIHWYIYWGHMKIGWECRVMDDEGHQNRVRQLKGALDGLITQNSWHLPEGAEFLDKNKPEYECIKSGTEPTKCKDRPENILGYNPISDEAEGNAESDTDYDSIKEFLDYIEQLAKTDPEIERIIQEFINNHEENPTTGLIGDGETVRFTNGFNTFVVPEYDQVVLKEISNLASATVTVTPTMTASGSVTATETASSMPTLTAVKSARLAYIDTAPFINKGLEIFQYNGASANKWLSTANGDSIPYMKAGIGYYIYNPGTTVGVEIQKADIAETASLKPSLQKGWNLVANSGEKSLNLDEIKHSIVAGNDKTLVEMAKADEIYNRMYLIQDGTAIEATKAFRLLNPLATDTTQQIVGVLKPYWVYVK